MGWGPRSSSRELGPSRGSNGGASYASTPRADRSRFGRGGEHRARGWFLVFPVLPYHASLGDDDRHEAPRGADGAVAVLATSVHADRAPSSESGAGGAAGRLQIENGCHVIHLLSRGRRNGRVVGRSPSTALSARRTPAEPVARSIDSRASWSPTNA